MGPAKGGGNRNGWVERRRGIKRRLRVGCELDSLPRLGRKIKNLLQKWFSMNHEGKKLWTPNWLHDSVLAPVKEIMLYEGGKVLASFPCEIHFLKIGKIHIWHNFFKSSCLKKLELEPFWGKNPLWFQWVQLSLQARSWLHRLRPLPVVTALFSPCKTGSFSWKQKTKNKKQEFLWDVVNIVLNTTSAFLDN